jgi:hypothetical protein
MAIPKKKSKLEELASSVAADDNTDSDLGDPRVDTVKLVPAEVEAITDLPPTPAPSVWRKVDTLSDEHMTVEAASLVGYQFKKTLLRFWSGERLLDQIVTVDGVNYHIDKGFANR